MVMTLLQEVTRQPYSHWLAAASVSGGHQATAFAKLGLWYADFKADVPRARKCFQRALGLNPLQSEAGEACPWFDIPLHPRDMEPPTFPSLLLITYSGRHWA